MFVFRYQAHSNITGLGSLYNFDSKFSRIALKFYSFITSKSYHTFFQNSSDLGVFMNISRFHNYTKLNGSGVDLNYFDIKRFTQLIHKKNRKKIKFIFSGRLLVSKGIMNYIHAAEIISVERNDVEFHIVGFIDEQNSDSISRSLLMSFHDKGIIIYHGSTDDVRCFLALSDCIIFPSSYREGTPRCLIESCSMSLPIITTNSVGCRDTVIDGMNGFLCKKNNIEDLVRCIKQFLHLDSHCRQNMCLESRNLAKNFNEEDIIVKYLSVINSCNG